jgi:hypothetical protein
MRPACDLSTQKGIILSDPESVVHRPLSGTSSSTINGYTIYKLVISTQTTAITQHKITVDRLYGFQLALYFFPPSRFNRIEIDPIDNINGRIWSPVNAIKLILEDSITLRTTSG